MTTAAAAHPLIQANLLGEALEHGPVAAFVFDDDGRYVAVNAYACRLLGYSREELLTLRADSLAASAAALNDYIAVVRGARPEGRVRVIRKDGSEIELVFRAYETTVAGMTFYVGAAWPLDDAV